MHRDDRDRSQGHARVHGSPGERPRIVGLLRAVGPLFIVMAVAGYLLRAVLPVPEISSTSAGIMFLALAVALAAAIGATQGRVANYLKGAHGEEWVARELSFLPDTCEVFHGLALNSGALMRCGGDLDHIVVGPEGVFTIETKNWDGVITIENGRILYNGLAPSRPPLAQVRQAAERLREMLQACRGSSIVPRPVICFAANTVQGGTQEADNVVICNLQDLNELICSPSANPLDPETRSRIVAQLKRTE